MAQPSPLLLGSGPLPDGRRAPPRGLDANTAAYLERLLSSNSARIQNDLVERVRESRRRLEAEIRSRLSEAVQTAVSALERAKARHAEGEASVAAEIERLDGLRHSAQRIGGVARALGIDPPRGVGAGGC